MLTDVIAAECVYVLESFYEVDRAEIAELMRATIGFRSIDAPGSSTLLRALDLYEDGSDFTDSYLVACAENSGINAIASFDRGIDRVGTVRRID